MNKKVKGNRHVFQNKCSRTNESADGKHSTSEEHLSHDKICDDCSGKNAVYCIDKNNENIELRKDRKVPFEKTPSVKGSRSSHKFRSHVKLCRKQNARITETDDKQMQMHSRRDVFASELNIKDRSSVCNNAIGRRNVDMHEISQEHYRKGSCSDDEQGKFVNNPQRTQEPKSTIVINKRCDSKSNTCSGASPHFVPSNFHSCVSVSNKSQLLNTIGASSGNTEASVVKNHSHASHNIGDSHESISSCAHNVDPYMLVSKYTSEINHLSDWCFKNHLEELGKISVQVNNATVCEDILNILKSQKNNMLSQQKCFGDFIRHAHNKMNELHSECNTDVVTMKAKKIFSEVEYECKLFSNMCPAYSLKQVLKTAMKKFQVTVISCDITFRCNIVVPLLLRSINPGMIVSCELNSAVALLSAQNCSDLIDQRLSQFVGYDTGQEILKSNNTKVFYTTVQGLFTYSLEDPLFSKYSCIVLNDFLYRNIEADILLASVRECLGKRDDLRVVILAATQHSVENFKRFFSRNRSDNVSVINAENLNFPVQVIWKQSLCNPDDDDDDVTTEAVNICFSIHVMESNDKRNVLVFLPTKDDAVKAVEFTMQKLCEHSFTDVFCTFINEKTKRNEMLQIWQQQQLKRVFIFVNSGFEFVLFPNVYYVVDFGRTNEVSYDTEKKIEVQKMSFISRHRAEIRKKYAGLYTTGICFRMYNKRNYKKNMVYNESPEVLSRSPINSLIKIFKFRPDSALAIEFIEPFSKQVKENALSALQGLGALENGKLTRLGECLVKLPFPPEYSKLIILGKQQGLLFEVVILVSFFLTKLGNVFQNKSTGDLKRKVDAVKLHFLQNDSDTLTFLNLYTQWVKNEYSKSWCSSKYIEFSFLDCVRSKMKEVCEIIKNILGETVPDKFDNDYQLTPDVYSTLQQIIFESFRDNLCVYSGHFGIGYRSLTAHCFAFLHRSTFITAKRNLPQFIVYDRFISKTDNFITHITAIPDSCVTDALDHGLLKVKQNALFNQKLVPHVIDPVGLSVIKHALTKEKLKDLEEQIKRETKSEFVVIEPSEEQGSVTVYCLPDNWDKAEEIMRKFLDENIETYWDEEEAQILEHQKGDSTVSVNIVWSKGGEISSVVVDAQQEISLDSQSDSPCADSISVSETIVAHSCILLSWLRRPCAGDGFVEFSKFEDFSKARKLAMRRIEIKGAKAEVVVNTHEKYQLSVHGLGPEVTEEDLKKAFQEKLADVSFSDVKVRRLSLFKTDSDGIKAVEESLREQCNDIFERSLLKIKVHKPENDEEIIMTAEAHPSGSLNTFSLEDITACLNGVLKVCDTNVKAKVSYYSFLFCSTDIWDKVEPCVNHVHSLFIQKLEKNNTSCDIEVKASDSQTQRLKISSEREDIVAELRKIVQNLLEGTVITSADNKCLPMLFCHGGHLFLRALQNRANAHIIDDYKTKSIHLYGSEENCKVATLEIMEYLNHVEEETVKIMSLDRGENSRTLLRNIIQTYDVELKQFIEVCKLRSAELNIQKCELTLCGSVESIEKAESLLENLEESESDSAPSSLSGQEQCPVCFSTVLTRAIRLEACGHLYCRVCSTGMVNMSQFPIKCYVIECNKLVILEDIRRILDYDTEKLKELSRRSLKHFISQNRNFIYCPAPDCPMFLDKEKVSDTKWNCPLCHNDICFKCSVIYHDGYTCDVYQGMKTDPDYQFKVWRESNPDCKHCPKCQTAIQKTEGCNHMHCLNCNSHFCWRCRNLFDNGMEILYHQSSCKGDE